MQVYVVNRHDSAQPRRGKLAGRVLHKRACARQPHATPPGIIKQNHEGAAETYLNDAAMTPFQQLPCECGREGSGKDWGRIAGGVTVTQILPKKELLVVSE
eukprot:3941894-Rhodomonas_salina.4